MPPLDKAGPANAPQPYPESGGMPFGTQDQLILVPFNDPAALEAAFAAHGHEAAVLMMEPINYDQAVSCRNRALCNCAEPYATNMALSSFMTKC